MSSVSTACQELVFSQAHWHPRHAVWFPVPRDAGCLAVFAEAWSHCVSVEVDALDAGHFTMLIRYFK